MSATAVDIERIGSALSNTGIELTKDERLIRSILEDDTVIDGFSNGERLKDLSNALYFYDKDVGIFPARVAGRLISIHAAVTKKNRGAKAIKSARSLVKALVGAGYEVIARIRYNDKHVKRFVTMVGFIYSHDKNNYHIYRYA